MAAEVRVTQSQDPRNGAASGSGKRQGTDFSKSLQNERSPVETLILAP